MSVLLELKNYHCHTECLGGGFVVVFFLIQTMHFSHFGRGDFIKTSLLTLCLAFSGVCSVF